MIDDFFSLSLEPKATGKISRSARAFDVAQKAYLAYGLQGSSEKDIRDASKAKVIGAEVCADETALRFRFDVPETLYVYRAAFLFVGPQ